MIDNALLIEGWMSPAELVWLAETAKNSKIIIEVGCFKGRSTRALADNCDGVIYAVDPWNGELRDSTGKLEAIVNDSIFDEFILNLYTKVTKANVIVSREPFTSFARYYTGKVDFIFIDGNHDYYDVIKDISNAKRLVRKGGIIAGHDYRACWPNVINAVNNSFEDQVNICDTIWWKYND